MIKGWRLDPAWVKLMQDKEIAKRQRRHERIVLEREHEMIVRQNTMLEEHPGKIVNRSKWGY